MPAVLEWRSPTQAEHAGVGKRRPERQGNISSHYDRVNDQAWQQWHTSMDSARSVDRKVERTPRWPYNDNRGLDAALRAGRARSSAGQAAAS
jgi:hypothetical protein